MENNLENNKFKEDLFIISGMLLHDNEIVRYTDENDEISYYSKSEIDFENIDKYTIIDISYSDLTY